MIIKLSPQRRDDTLTVSKLDDILTINGVAYDFSGLLEGETLPREAIDCEFIASDADRINGELELTLLLPHGADPTQAQAFPEDIIDPPNGDLVLPLNTLEVSP